MANESVDHGEVRRAVKAVLQQVPQLRRIETRMGAIGTWSEQQGWNRVYAEIGIASAEERGAGNGPQAWEILLVRIDLMVPFGGLKYDTEPFWDDVLTNTRRVLRQYPTLGNQIEGLSSPGLPQLRDNSVKPYSDVQAQLLVHHARFELTLRRNFTYTLSATLP